MPDDKDKDQQQSQGQYQSGNSGQIGGQQIDIGRGADANTLLDNKGADSEPLIKKEENS